MRSWPCLLSVLALVLACSSPTPAPADASNDLVTTIDAPDAATDSPPDRAPADVITPIAPYTCMPCLYDRECGEGGACVPLDPMNAPGLRTCQTACKTRGSACAAPVAATCQESDSGALVCVPTVSCIPMESRRNVACPANGCVGRYRVCADLARTTGLNGRTGNVCLAPCARDSDCEDATRRCLPTPTREGQTVLACVPDDRTGPDACGVIAVNPRGVGAPCDATTACTGGLECLADLDANVRGFCSAACTRDEDCGGGGVRCLRAGDRGMRCVPRDCECLAGTRDALLDRALAGGGAPPWTRCNLYFTSANLDAFPPAVTRDRFRLPVFDRVHRDWLAGARWAKDTGPALDRRVTSLSAALAATASLRADGTTTSVAVPSPEPVAMTASALVDSLVAIYEHGAAQPDRAMLTTATQALPPTLQQSLARVLRASLDAARARDRGLPFATDPAERDRLFAIGPAMILPVTAAEARPDFTTAFDLGTVQGDVTLPTDEALKLAATIEAIDWASLRGMRGPSLDLDTPLGRVVVRDADAQTYTEDALPRALVVIDLGGDDTYEAPVAANSDSDNSVSVLVDLAGSDTYGYRTVASPLDRMDLLPSDRGGRARTSTAGVVPSVSRTGRQGSARLGVALHYDLGASNDRYRSLRMSQGFASMGVGGLYDDGGDDEYTLEAGGQGAAVVGLAALVDAGGNDRYTAWAFAEGFAYVRGVGMLYDRDGRDTYDSKQTPVLYVSPQNPMTNSSFTQGAGFGRRGDAAPDRISMSGGIGVLRDRVGDDQYSTSIFGQGTGYWGAMGLLLDGAGDDTYDGRWYVQAGIAHFAYGALVDGGGRDVHNGRSERQNMTAGAGHDFSLGVFLALGPEGDEYRVPNLALGAGNANGVGIFADEGGDDTYDAVSALSLGNAAYESLTDMGRLMRPTVGIFLDANGMDTYRRTPAGPVGNDRTWAQRIHTEIEAQNERGFGADESGAALGLWE